MSRLSLSLVGGGTTALVLAYGSALLPGDPPVWSAFALAVGVGALLAGLLLFGAARNGAVSPGIVALFLGTGLWVAGGLSLLLALPGVDPPDAALVFGLPRRAAFLLLGVGVAPGLVVPVAYARVFDRHTLTEEDLERLRRVAAEVRAEREGAGDPVDGDTA
ncbi:MAG TPA: hypothetical protein VK858_05485 [Longimicrobiales bacterium]|nr:hypothetical protein [Longimicrobiales bacterium]